jgi:hypothetical protein
MDLQLWKTGKVEDAIQPGDAVTIGFDGSLRDDSTAPVACRVSDGLLQILGIWESPDGDWRVIGRCRSARLTRA